MRLFFQSILLLFLGILFPIESFGQQSNLDVSALKNHKIVLLGEQTHGDGAVFKKKLEIVKALHEKGGFTILAFECGLYDNFKANQLYTSKKEGKNIFKQSISYFYSSTKVFEDLLDYVEANPKLKILGFDSQESYLFEEYFLEDLRELCSKNNIAISNKDLLELEKVLIVRDLEGYVDNPRDSIALYDNMQSLFDKINSIPKNSIETKVLVQTFKSAFSDMDFSLKSLQKNEIYVQNPRDEQLAENLIFLQETFPNEKIIGWGANYHFANRLNEFKYTKETENYIKNIFHQLDSIIPNHNLELDDEIEQIVDLKYAQPMGKFLKEKYGDELFSLAFTAYKGTYLDIFHDKTFSIQKPPKNSLETQIKNQNQPSKLELLKNNPSKFYTSALGYIPLLAEWRNVFDGIYYIEKTYPPVFSTYDSQTTSARNEGKRSFIDGIIVDRETGKEISYADVYYTDNNKSAVSDTEGKYFIPNRLNKANFLVFSAIGYESDSVQIQQLHETNRILLNRSKEEVISLNEVVVTGNHKSLTPEEVLKRARKNIVRNYFQGPFNQDFHFKITENEVKDTLSYGEEAVIETYCSRGINGSNKPENHFFGNITHLRNNTQKYDNDRFNNGVGSLWVVLNKDIILSKSNILYRTSSYNLKNEGTVLYEGKKVHKITFVNNSPGAYSTGYGYPAPKSSNGTIFIDTDNYAILKYEHHIIREPFQSKKKKNFINYSHKIVQSYKKVNDKYFINLLEVVTRTDVFSPEDEFLNAHIKQQKLVSNNIETQNVNVYQRPITDLKKGYKMTKNDDFWDDQKLDFYLEIPVKKDIVVRK